MPLPAAAMLGASIGGKILGGLFGRSDAKRQAKDARAGALYERDISQRALNRRKAVLAGLLTALKREGMFGDLGPTGGATDWLLPEPPQASTPGLFSTILRGAAAGVGDYVGNAGAAAGQRESDVRRRARGYDNLDHSQSIGATPGNPFGVGTGLGPGFMSPGQPTRRLFAGR